MRTRVLAPHTTQQARNLSFTGLFERTRCLIHERTVRGECLDWLLILGLWGAKTLFASPEINDSQAGH